MKWQHNESVFGEWADVTSSAKAREGGSSPNGILSVHIVWRSYGKQHAATWCVSHAKCVSTNLGVPKLLCRLVRKDFANTYMLLLWAVIQFLQMMTWLLEVALMRIPVHQFSVNCEGNRWTCLLYTVSTKSHKSLPCTPTTASPKEESRSILLEGKSLFI